MNEIRSDPLLHHDEEEDEHEKLQLIHEAVIEKRFYFFGLFLGINLIFMFVYVSETWMRLNYFALVMIDILMNAIITKYLLRLSSLTQRDVVNWWRFVLLSALRVLVQTYLGSQVPYYILYYFSLFGAANTYYCKRWMVIVHACSLFASSLIGQVVVNHTTLRAVEHGVFLTRIHVEKQTPFISGFHPSTFTLWSDTINILLVEIVLTLSCLIFSQVIELQFEANVKYKYQVQVQKALNYSKSKFIGNLSHEMRNPLHGIINNTDLLKMETERIVEMVSSDMEKNKENIARANLSNLELIEDVITGSQMLLRLLSNSLQVTNLELGNIKLNYQPFNVFESLESIISVFFSIANKKGLSIQSCFNFSKVPFYVNGDNVKISQILMNLVSNSVKYTTTGFVTLKCDVCDKSDMDYPFHGKPDDEKFTISGFDNLTLKDIVVLKYECIDTGAGMKNIDNSNNIQSCSAHSSQEFDHYFNQSNTQVNSTFNDSNGLGLNISKNIIDLMKGQMYVKSAIGKGTIVTVYLPVVKCSNGTECQDIKNRIETLKDSNKWRFPLSQVMIYDPHQNIRDLLEDYCKQLFPDCSAQIFSNDKDFKGILSNYIHTATSNTLQNTLLIYPQEFESLDGNSLHYLMKTETNILLPLSERGQFSSIVNRCKHFTRPIKLKNFVEILYSSLIDHHDTRSTTTNSISIEALTSPLRSTSSNIYSSRNIKVLVVDDNEVNRKVLTRMMTLLGFSVMTASDGLHALEMVKKNPHEFQVILMDLFMPLLSGKECCKLIRELNISNLKIVAVTANVWENEESLKPKFGFDAVVHKPIMMKQLEEQMTVLLDCAAEVNNKNNDPGTSHGSPSQQYSDQQSKDLHPFDYDGHGI
ncbi:hypothetical protein C9374_010562 [Naegleria lovaniensis]|uniref:Histidine kinase n=1 Tax=Naegleria lovaniensis TaxID=51637 RepID=A0AA88GG38_NAELO|nr:uncharacterized protein C9374_010562 [Naegleria lovaniensis]KAG2374543.1 hypothetical protein C9374_010562 [Naegleria lovaniensis]